MWRDTSEEKPAKVDSISSFAICSIIAITLSVLMMFSPI